MKKEAILEKLNEIFKDVFDDEELNVTETMTAEDVEDWDSLMHISLIVAIEKTFEVKFSMTEVTSMKNVGEMINIIAERTK